MESAPSNISSTTSVQVDRLERAYTHGRLYKAIIIVLLIIIISVSFFVYALLTRSSLIPTDISSLLLETVVCKSCKTGELDEKIEDDESLIKEGWAKYSFPKYGFSIQLPDTSYYSEYFPTERYVWSIYSYNAQKETEFKIIPNFEEVVSISYFPINPPSTGTEIDIFRGSQIKINFYENPQKLNIQQIETNFKNKIENEVFKNYLYEEEKLYSSEFTKLFGKEAFNYQHSAAMFSAKGSILLTDNYIVEIDKSANFSEGVHLDLVEQVINTIKFD